jgi:hypothetical protein
MMLSGWLNAVGLRSQETNSTPFIPADLRPRFDPVSSLMRPANPELRHRLGTASIPTVNQTGPGKRRFHLGANARRVARL